MRPRQGFLFWGLLLIPLGAIPLLVRAGVLDVSGLLDAWRLWPLLLVGVGLAILIGRTRPAGVVTGGTRAAVVGTVVSALTLATLGGVALANPGSWIGAVTHCGPGSQTQALHRQGAFARQASGGAHPRCGSL